MSLAAFFDTNIFVYADDASAAVKQATAIKLIDQHVRSGTAVTSLQVMQEYYAVATRKVGVTPDVAQRKVELMCGFKVVQFSPKDVISAIELHRLRHISFWDAMIIHAARAGGASVLYSEDLQADSVWGGLKLVNPFAETTKSAAGRAGTRGRRSTRS